MNIKRIAVVVNSKGGRKCGLAVLERAKPIFVNAEIDLNIHVTQRSGHPTEIAQLLNK